jgi:hypothetical protein
MTLDLCKARELAQSAIERHELARLSNPDGCGDHDMWEDWPCESIHLATALLQAGDEVEALRSDVELLKRATGWDRYFEAKAQPLRAKADAWDRLRADMQQLDTPCRQWVEGLMVDLLADE